MATNFPTSLDSLTNPTASDKLNSPSHSTQHATINDAVEAIEAKLGVNGSAVTGTIDYLVKSASSSNPGHKHTLANGATDVTATAAEVSYCSGVTSAIQTQLNGKEGTITTLSVTKGGTGAGTLNDHYVLIGSGTSAITPITPSDAGKVLTSNGTGADPSFQTLATRASYEASDDLIISADTERTTTNASYEKKKEIKIVTSGRYRIKFDLKSDGGSNCLGRIYKSGVAFGTEQSTGATSYITKSEDLLFGAGDTIELWIKTGTTGYCRNFRIYGALFTDNVVVTD